MTSKIGLLIVLGVMAGMRTEILGGGLVSGREFERANTAVAERAPVRASESSARFELKFRDAALGDVLGYLSRLAGLVIVSDQSLNHHVDVWSETSVTRDEAIDLLNNSLVSQGASAVVAGRKLTIMRTAEAKGQRTSITIGADPEKIPMTEKLATQIIPVRFVEVTKLLNDLRPLVSQEAVLTANESANTLIVTDQQRNIQKLAQIIAAIDSSAEDPMQLRTFSLKNSSATEMADLLSELFPDQSTDSGNGSTGQFAPFGGGGGPPGDGGGPGGPGGFGPGGDFGSSSSGSSSHSARLQKRARVIAQADERTASVVVIATETMMPQIERVVDQLDSNGKGRQTVSVYPFANSSVTTVKQIMSDLFQKKNSGANNGSTSTQSDPLETRRTTQTQNQQSQNQQTSSSRAGGNSGSGGLGGGGGPGGQ